MALSRPVHGFESRRERHIINDLGIGDFAVRHPYGAGAYPRPQPNIEKL